MLVALLPGMANEQLMKSGMPWSLWASPPPASTASSQPPPLNYTPAAPSSSSSSSPPSSSSSSSPSSLASPAAPSPYAGMYEDTSVSDSAPYPVEFCKRIADLPGNSAFKFDHWWVKTPDFEAGMGPANGGVPGHGGVDSPFVTKTTVNDHTGQSKLPSATCVPAEQVDPMWANQDAACLKKELGIGKDTGKWSPFNQCHTVIQDALDKCGLPTNEKLDHIEKKLKGSLGESAPVSPMY